MGYVYRDKRTGWYVGEYFDARGKRRRKSLSRVQRQAESTLALIESKVIRERLAGVKETLPANFSEFAGRYLGRVEEGLRPKTVKRYRTSLNQLKPFFGNVELTSISPEMVDQYKRTRMQGIVEAVKKQKHWATVNRDLQVLRSMLNVAIEWGYARENPVRSKLFFKESKGRIRYLTRQEYDRLLKTSREDIRSLMIVAVHTGLRLNELLALNWGDVDLENGFVFIGNPKDNQPTRIPLNPDASQLLEEMKGQAKSVTVFVSSVNGRPLKDQNVQRQFSKAVKRAEMADLTFHDLRHTCASWLVMAGVELRIVKEILRHKDIRTTMRYAHLAPDYIKGGVNRLSEFLRSKPSATGQSS